MTRYRGVAMPARTMTGSTAYTVLLAVAFVLCAGDAAHAEPARQAAPSIYVAQAASGSGDGSSCSNARPVSFFNAASSWGSGKSIAPGATVGLCGTITSTLIAQGDGSSGSPITISFQPGARLSQPVCPSATGCLDLNGRSYITVNGNNTGVIEDTANGTGLAYQSSSKGIDAEPCDSCTIENLTIQNIYVHTGTGVEVDQTQTNAIKFHGSNITISGNTIHDVGWALFENNSAGNGTVHITGNDIYNVDHGWILGGPDGAAMGGDFWFDHNHLHDMANWDNAANGYHHDGIHCYTGGTSGMHIPDLYIYDNTFDGEIGANATAWMFLEGPNAGTACNDSTSNIWIFNNYATSVTHGAANSVLLTSAGHVFYANNTLAMPSPTAKNGNDFESPSCVGMLAGGTYVNNLIGGCNTLIGGSSSATFDHNAYFNCSGSYNCFWVGSTDTGLFATYQAAGYEPHSVANLALATPPNGAGVGENLTSMCTGNLTPLCTDITGALRPLRMPPDAGAYQLETAAVTADSIGRVRLGAPRASVEQFYGRRRAVRSKRPIFGVFDVRGVLTATYHEHKGALTVSYTQQGNVAAVTTTSMYYTTDYRTSSGLGVGVTADESKLAKNGWRECGRVLVRRRGGRATAIRTARGHVVALTVSRSQYLFCPKSR